VKNSTVLWNTTAKLPHESQILTSNYNDMGNSTYPN
jgi:hypothetical protein